MSSNNKVLMTRLILQRIIASEVFNKHICKRDRDIFNNYFLTMDEERLLSSTRSMTLSFKTTAEIESYYGQVSSLDIQWKPVEAGLQDLDGNLWSSERISMHFSISSAYGQDTEKTRERLECIAGMMALADDIAALVPGPVGILTHNNEQRLAKEAHDRHQAAREMLSRVIVDAKLNRAMRVGSRRQVRADRPEFKDMKFETGDYVFETLHGSRRRPWSKRYKVSVVSGLNYYTFTRIT